MKKTRRPGRPAYLNVEIDERVRAELKADADLRGQTMPVRLHEILCRELGLDDLLVPQTQCAAD